MCSRCPVKFCRSTELLCSFSLLCGESLFEKGMLTPVLPESLVIPLKMGVLRTEGRQSATVVCSTRLIFFPFDDFGKMGEYGSG